MSELGAILIPGNSGLLVGPLGNVLMGYNGYMLGLTTEDTSLANQEDVKDILYSQEGTQPSDHVTTGKLLVVNGAFAEISTALLKLIVPGFNSLSTPGVGDDSATIGRFIYTSHRQNRAKALRLYATNSGGNALLDDESVLNCYEAIFLITDTILNWGADTQRNVAFQCIIYYHKFGVDQVLGGPSGAFGYYGDPSQEKVPATTWPDVAAPLLLTAEATAATSLDLTFDEAIATQVGATADMIVCKVNGEFVNATVIGVPVGAVSTLTFPAASFANGDVIEISISALAFQDLEVTPNLFIGVDGQTVINSVP